MAEKELVDRNYENALRYYKTALALQPDDIKVREAMAEILPARKNMIQHSFYIWKSFNLTNE